MNATSALPAKLDRVGCARCRIVSPMPLMRIEGMYYVCRNEVACRKRERKHAPQNAAPVKRAAPEPAKPAKRSATSRRRADE